LIAVFAAADRYTRQAASAEQFCSRCVSAKELTDVVNIEHRRCGVSVTLRDCARCARVPRAQACTARSARDSRCPLLKERFVMTILTVGPHSTYATIAAALKVAHASDTISLEAGYRNESVSVNVNDLSVTGAGSSTGIHLTLGAGITAITLQGSAPINVTDNSGANTIAGNGGANVISVSGGADVVHGGGGKDTLIVKYDTTTSDVIGSSVNISDGGTHSVTYDGFENFRIATGSGNDTITVGNGVNNVKTGGGNDTITGGDGSNTVFGGGGNDTVTVGDGANAILGDTGNDTITAGNGANVINGGTGDDTLSAGDGDNKIIGGSGDDVITSGDGRDTITAGLGNDSVDAGGGNDTIYLMGGNDRVDGGAGKDTLDYSQSALGVKVSLATTAAQTVNANATDTLLNIENLNGSGLDDSLTGSAGNNVLDGNAGKDVLKGGLGDDTLSGGGSNDRFVFHHGDGNDTITDFSAGNSGGDVIELSGYGIGSFSELHGMMSQVGQDTVIIFDSTDHLTLHNVSMGNLNSGDFILS
jgi:Ca2+-binding RTX toxin-like protein